MLKPAKIIRKNGGTCYELRAGHGGRGRLLWTIVGVIPNQPKSKEHAFKVLEEVADWEGYLIINESYFE